MQTFRVQRKSNTPKSSGVSDVIVERGSDVIVEGGGDVIVERVVTS